MTPKEKAIELFDKFSLGYYHVQNAKRCAMIAADEVINTFDISPTDISSRWNVIFWQSVKKEINKLAK